ncbi:MAG TPA: STAS domain-containing protein [Candidatus Baltobacteraceae bacterium]|nr:STAS domain-containing protein [Candidatus Baltobacteraceae bacterium]
MIEEVFGHFTLSEIQDTPVLTLKGEIDFSNVPDLQKALAAMPAEDVVIDMSEVEFMDSSALAALVRYRKVTVSAGGSVTLVIASPLVLRVFEITNFDREFKIVKRLADVAGLFPKA